MSLELPAPWNDLLTERGHRFTSLWKIARTDGTLYRYTSHNRPIVYKGATFLPGGALDASAHKRETGLVEMDREIRAVITDDEIKADELRAGRFDGARVTEWFVDWRYPWVGGPRHEYTIAKVQWNESRWIADCVGITHLLIQEGGDVISRHCRWKSFGATDLDPRCGIDLQGNHPDGQAYRLSNIEVFDLPEPWVINAANTTVPSSYAGRDFDYGYIEFTGGANRGIRLQVQRFWEFSGEAGNPWGEDNVFELMYPPPFPVEDAASGSPANFLAVMGCDRTWERCGYHQNRDRFGGFPHLPGTDDANKSDHYATR